MADKRRCLIQQLSLVISLLLVVTSLFFIGHRLNQQWQELSRWQPDWATSMTVLMGVFAYASACLFLSNAWRQLLCSTYRIQLTASVLTHIYARSQVGKYIPGNIFHIAGRHALGRQVGISHRLLAYAAIAEMVGLMSAALTVAILGGGAHQFFAGWLNLPLLLTTFSGFCFLFVLLYRYKRPMMETGYRTIIHYLSLGALSAWWISYLSYIGFFLVAGVTLLALVMVMSDAPPLQIIPVIIGSFSIAWAAGFLTPGAPSGIGIREAILVLALETTMTQTDAVLTALLFRFITVLGDVMFFMFFGRSVKVR